MFTSQKSLRIIVADNTNISNLQPFSVDKLRSAKTTEVAKSLVGAYLITNINGLTSGGRIVETEAYKAPEDKASHAHLNKRTKRTEVMFATAGAAYVYLCYGIHHLFNVVSGPKGVAHAILIRAIHPLWGIEDMKIRRGTHAIQQLTNGPGKLSEALQISTKLSGINMLDPHSKVKLFESANEKEISLVSAKRIGVDYAEECKDWPWRFYDGQSDFVSKR